MDLGDYYIYFIIEDSVKEVLYGPEELLHLLYHRSVCQRFSIDLRYYFIYYIIEVHFFRTNIPNAIYRYLQWRYSVAGQRDSPMILHNIETKFKLNRHISMLFESL